MHDSQGAGEWDEENPYEAMLGQEELISDIAFEIYCVFDERAKNTLAWGTNSPLWCPEDISSMDDERDETSSAAKNSPGKRGPKTKRKKAERPPLSRVCKTLGITQAVRKGLSEAGLCTSCGADTHKSNANRLCAMNELRLSGKAKDPLDESVLASKKEKRRASKRAWWSRNKESELEARKERRRRNRDKTIK